MNTKQIEALKLALEPVMSVYITKDSIEDWWHKMPEGRHELGDITAIREALMSVPDGAQSRSDVEQPAQQEPKILGSTAAEIHDAIDEAHELGGPLHERIKKLVHQAHAKPATRTDQQIVDQTEELAVWLLSWAFNRQPETLAPVRESDHPIAERCWAAACHIQEMLTDTDPENAVAELDSDPEQQPAQQQEPVFWYRPCSNGMYEGPIHNASIEKVRKESGGWQPLYTSPPIEATPLANANAGKRSVKPWVGLTDEEQEIASWADGSFGAGARWAEAKLRERNEHSEKNT